MKFLSYNSVQYCEDITNYNNMELKNQSLVIKINKIEKNRGFFISIPAELDGYIYKINFLFKNPKQSKQIYFEYSSDEECELIKIFKQTDLYTVYWIGINNLDLNPYDYDDENSTYYITDLDDYIEIFFDSSIIDLEQYNYWTNNISIDMYVKNYLVGTNHNLMLKYKNGQINLELESDWIEKYNMDLEDKIKNIIIELVQLQNTQYYAVEKYLEDENIICLIKKYINL